MRTLPAATFRVLAYSSLQRHQVGVGHIDFAANLERRRRIFALQSQRHIGNRADIVSDIVSDAAVTARHAAHEEAILVQERNGYTVDLQLDDPFHRFAREQFGDTLAVLAQLLDAVGVVDREHRPAMLDLLQVGDGLFADALGGAVGRNQFRMLRFELL
jgi:hypothetical protein